MHIEPSPLFTRELKRLTKKFPSLRIELRQVLEDLENDPHHGESMGGGFYKIRVPIASKGVGKRGGARIEPMCKSLTTLFTSFQFMIKLNTRILMRLF